MKHSVPTSYAVRHRLACEGLGDALDAVFDGDLVGDRAIAERLVRILGAAMDLCEMHNVDGRGRCATCWTMPRRWWRPWPRRSQCSVYSAFVIERADGTERRD